jgi:hypothetical protein
MTSVASRSTARIEAPQIVNGLARHPLTAPLKIFFKREQTVRLCLIYEIGTTQPCSRREEHNDETHDNSYSYCAHAPEHARACKHGSSRARRQGPCHAA